MGQRGDVSEITGYLSVEMTFPAPRYTMEAVRHRPGNSPKSASDSPDFEVSEQ